MRRARIIAACIPHGTKLLLDHLVGILSTLRIIHSAVSAPRCKHALRGLRCMGLGILLHTIIVATRLLLTAKGAQERRILGGRIRIGVVSLLADQVA